MVLNLILIAIILIQIIFHYIERRSVLNKFVSLINCNDDENAPNSFVLSSIKDKYRHTHTKHIPSAHERVLNKWKNRSQAGD